jgi:hypothetical protein
MSAPRSIFAGSPSNPNAALDALHAHRRRPGGDPRVLPRERAHVVVPQLVPARLRREHQREARIAAMLMLSSGSIWTATRNDIPLP